VLGRRSERVCDGEPAYKPDSSAVVGAAELAFVVGSATRASRSTDVSTCHGVAAGPEDLLRTRATP